MMPVLIIMVGLPGSGKSYRAKDLADKYSALVFSSDTYRRELLGDESDQSNNQKVFDTLYAHMIAQLRGGSNCIFDATNTTLKTRANVLNRVRDIPCNKIAYVMSTPVEVCISRDANRVRTVGKDVINKFLYSYQYPQFFEGFDAIILDGWELNHLKVDRALADTLYKEMYVFDQHNPHHKYRLWEHCDRLSNNYIFNHNTAEYYAAMYHDIGKLFTCKFDERGVAHYYNHDNVGAYFVVSHPNILDVTELSDRMFAEIVFFINYHMRAHRDFRAPKAETKYRKIFGDALYERLIQFGQYDRKASGTYQGEE